MKNDFRTDLRYSELASDEEFWKSVYAKAFPNMVNLMLGSGDTQSQRLGIDRVILLANGRLLRIDEKKRREEYTDICIEYLSNDSQHAPGWIEKDLPIDYLAYAFMQSKRVYLFDWLMLRRAWLGFGEEWKKTYRHVIAKNSGYNTHSVAVPIDVVMRETSRARVIQI